MVSAQLLGAQACFITRQMLKAWRGEPEQKKITYYVANNVIF